MKRVLIIAVCTILVSINALPSYAKGSPDKIVISAGPANSYELTDKETLKSFDPWSGQFIDWSRGTVAAPVDVSTSCKVFFYMKWDGRRSNYDRGDLKMVYTLMYVPGHDSERGYVYLPGRGEEFFQNNIGTIIRDNDDGKWHQASAAWDRVMTRLLSPRK